MVLVFAISAAAIHGRKPSSTAIRGQGMQTVPVQTVPVQLGDLSSVNTLTGTVSANLQTAVGTKVAARVQAVYVDIGQAVHTGQVLAQLDPSDLQRQLAQIEAQIQVDEAQLQSALDGTANSLAQAKADLNQARANYEQSRTDYQRYEGLYNSGAITKQQLEQARLKMENDQSQLEAKEKALKLAESGDNVAVARATLNKDQTAAAIIREQLSELTITSPVDGVVASKNIEVGEMVSPQTTLFNIAQIDPLQVTVNVSDQIIADIHPGTEAQITVPALGAKIFPGKVTKVSPVSDQVSHAYPVKIQIANPDRSMLPGMTASVVFTGLKTQPGIVIPVQAVVETPQGSEVFTVENGVAHMHMVQLGAVSSDKAVVLSGLKPGEQLVINGQNLLSDGSRVTVVQSADQAGATGMINQIKQGAKQ
ncbi:efflux RND transporter periplasmic adaptor subunit [Desulfofundulus thermobenzoicus]|uniref:Efflux RND transporter periplasmic adaptor subunit n=1 Tax=Desulfofundulus thermobenzoicus TaxID=29376 RepID=A0A6N7IMW7_9FIRM|nr:efflux RND transporter periplasmic adaptor subunit [Desulfofundulus thermobenzoicus]MQL50993.1 efflux RND transporter periplasmic adaptor subunit [Desulfofundulus thermobenzoicus]HHW43470.1 efflux RND transporter periplasmic adaptor subunit [Desulfotomaculum sp.]